MYDNVHGSLARSGGPAFGEPARPGIASLVPACENELCLGDNLEYMAGLLGRGFEGKFRLIYIDPPFFTRSSFNASVSVRDSSGASHKVHHLAYDDKFDRSLEYYIANMSVRLLLIRDLLADDGLMWIHLDWHSSHYIKLVLDEIMGTKNFVNEIIWQYKSGGSGKKHFARKHDTILVYSKTGTYYLSVPKEKSYNRDRKPYRFRGVAEYKDEGGWYTLVNMKDVWDIDMVGRTSAERTGYATQKPLELLRRIVESSSEEGDLCGDFFCGSGSLPAAAHMLGRRWMCCDSEEMAVSMTRRRLRSAGAEFDMLRLDAGEPERGRAAIEITGTDMLESGKRLYRCRLSDIVPDIDTGSIQLKDRKYVEEALKSDRLQFADHIMIDNHYSGSFVCRQIFDADPDGFSFVSDGSFRAIVADLFGREYEAEFFEK